VFISCLAGRAGAVFKIEGACAPPAIFPDRSPGDQLPGRWPQVTRPRAAACASNWPASRSGSWLPMRQLFKAMGAEAWTTIPSKEVDLRQLRRELDHLVEVLCLKRVVAAERLFPTSGTTRGSTAMRKNLTPSRGGRPRAF
jgi:hypothetical protein